MKIEMVNIAELKKADYNPRHMSGDMLEKLKKGISEFGMVEPIVINADNTVIGGHQRLEAAEQLGLTKLPCHRLNLDKKKEKALNLALNKLAGEWDYSKLAELLNEFESDPGFDLELTGFDSIEAVELANLGSFDAGDLLNGDDGIGGEGGGAGGKGYSIQYVLVFNDEEEQNIWSEWLKSLKERYPDHETISQRIIAHIQGE